MSQQFKFNILTGTDAQTKYDTITTKEPFTFYLLQTGVGYLGEKKLFDAASLENTEVTLTGKFFRAVASHVITQADLDNAKLSKPDGTAVGDAGILFTADNNDTDDGDELQYFVPVKIPATTTEINGTDPGNDIPTATAVVNYINQVLGNYVTFEVDGVAGTPASDGAMIFPGAYSTDEVRIGTWTNSEPLYRRVFKILLTDNNFDPIDIPGIIVHNICGVIIVNAGDSHVTMVPFPLTDSRNGNTVFSINFGYWSPEHPNAIFLERSNLEGNTNSVASCEIILEYTKTTDNGGT